MTLPPARITQKTARRKHRDTAAGSNQKNIRRKDRDSAVGLSNSERRQAEKVATLLLVRAAEKEGKEKDCDHAVSTSIR